MSDDAPPLKVRDILSLTTKLAEQILNTGSSGLSFSVSELEAVVKAAEFLQEHGVPWPPVVTEIIDSLAADMEEIRATQSGLGPDVRPLPLR